MPHLREHLGLVNLVVNACFALRLVVIVLLMLIAASVSRPTVVAASLVLIVVSLAVVLDGHLVTPMVSLSLCI